MPTLEPWEKWELDVQEALGLRGTVSSGSQFHDLSDGVGTDYDSMFRLMVDAKCTEKLSYSLKHKLLKQWVDVAVSRGMVFALPVRFANGGVADSDFVVVRFDDFVALVEQAKYAESPSVFSNKERKLVSSLIPHAPPKVAGVLESILGKM